MRGSEHGIRHPAGVVLLMRTLRIVLLLVSPALTGGAMLAAQAVERTDVPARGVLRVTFDPRIMTWNDEFTDAGRLKLGAPLTGDTVGGRYIPVVSRLEQNVRVVSGLSNFVASLGAGLLSVRQERRTYPTTAELGLTNRLSVSLMVPMVRVATRASFQYSARGANLGESADAERDRKSTRLNSSHGYISYAVFCLKKKNPSNRAHVASSDY